MKVLVITNIASPYRVDFFRYLQKSYPAYGFHILYATAGQEGREWTAQSALPDSYFLRSRSITVGKKGWERTIHFPVNPSETIRSIAPDVVVASEYNPTALAALSWCRRNKVPFVHWTDGTLVNERNLNPVQKWARRRIVGNADSFIASSSAAKRKLEAYGAKKEIFISFLTVDIDKYLAEKRESDATTLLTVGGLIERKGVDLLIEAMTKMRHRCRLLVVGGGPEEQKLKELARKHNVSAAFLGFLEGKALRSAYAAGDVFVTATREDCFGLVMLEAMCASLPIVASSYADGAYDLIDGNGRIADPFDAEAFAEAIDQTLDENGRDNALGRRSYERARLFSFARVAPPFVAAIDEAVKQ